MMQAGAQRRHCVVLLPYSVEESQLQELRRQNATQCDNVTVNSEVESHMKEVWRTATQCDATQCDNIMLKSVKRDQFDELRRQHATQRDNVMLESDDIKIENTLMRQNETQHDNVMSEFSHLEAESEELKCRGDNVMANSVERKNTEDALIQGDNIMPCSSGQEMRQNVCENCDGVACMRHDGVVCMRHKSDNHKLEDIMEATPHTEDKQQCDKVMINNTTTQRPTTHRKEPTQRPTTHQKVTIPRKLTPPHPVCKAHVSASLSDYPPPPGPLTPYPVQMYPCDVTTSGTPRGYQESLLLGDLSTPYGAVTNGNRGSAHLATPAAMDDCQNEQVSSVSMATTSKSVQRNIQASADVVRSVDVVTRVTATHGVDMVTFDSGVRGMVPAGTGDAPIHRTRRYSMGDTAHRVPCIKSTNHAGTKSHDSANHKPHRRRKNSLHGFIHSLNWRKRPVHVEESNPRHVDTAHNGNTPYYHDLSANSQNVITGNINARQDSNPMHGHIREGSNPVPSSDSGDANPRPAARHRQKRRSVPWMFKTLATDPQNCGPHLYAVSGGPHQHNSQKPPRSPDDVTHPQVRGATRDIDPKLL